MIWVAGKVVSDGALTVGVLDRALEHGLGLFETLRTWDGRAPLLGRHLNRMAASAAELGLPYGAVLPPDDGDVARLVAAQGLGGDVVLRITLTGGTDESGGATLWMRAGPLPAPVSRSGAVVALGPEVAVNDPLARHKTLNYWARRLAYESYRRLGYDEVLSVSRGLLRGGPAAWEGSRTNLFAVRNDTLMTPRLTGPIVPGVMRALVVEAASRLPLSIQDDQYLLRDELAAADEVFLTNSVRGLIPVARIDDMRWPVPGEWTRRLTLMVHDLLFPS